MRVLIDTDPGIDDAIALLLALRSPELDVAGVSVVQGNVGIEPGTVNALRILEIAGRGEVPVAAGPPVPLVREPRRSELVHGSDGLADLGLPAPEGKPLDEYAPALIVRMLEDSDEPTTIVALGPLTNLAIVLLSAPQVIPQIERVVLMGGSVRWEGNITPAAEYNIHEDPEAASIVFRSPVATTMIGLNVTMQAILGKRECEQLAASDDEIERLVGRLGLHIVRIYERFYGIPGFALHDPLAVGVAIDPSLIRTERRHVLVDLSPGPTAGQTLVDFWGIPEPWGEPNADVALDVEADRFLELLSTRLFGRHPI
jgi:inosine-uridine nucleoside N-ribohydrolase